jgi:hypothetical protein
MKKSRAVRHLRIGFLMLCVLMPTADGQTKAVGGLESKPLHALTQQPSSMLGRAAFRVRPGEWLHSESDNFIYHYFENFIATPVATEAEFHYKFIARELKKDTTKWERKCHIFVFDRQEDWEAFKGDAGLDPWTGGLHLNNELFILRDASRKWKGHVLAHETCHLVLDRFYSGGLPLWLNEGYAENSGVRSYASYFRARGYHSKPWSHKLKESDYVPMAEITQIMSYPENPAKISAFYVQSERMVRFLAAMDQKAFLRFMEEMSGGAYFQTALTRAYGTRWASLEDFEREFKAFALGDKSATDAAKVH